LGGVVKFKVKSTGIAAVAAIAKPRKAREIVVFFISIFFNCEYIKLFN
jgi:hypothetical protein